MRNVLKSLVRKLRGFNESKQERALKDHALYREAKNKSDRRTAIWRSWRMTKGGRGTMPKKIRKMIDDI